MDLISFILGMSIVVVIAVALVAVMAFVRVNKANKEIATINIIMSNESERVSRDMTDMQRDFYSSLDSRLDKLESKLSSRKA